MDKNQLSKIARLIIEKSIERNFQQLGIEGCLETIEKIRNPIYRGKMRMLHLQYLKSRAL